MEPFLKTPYRNPRDGSSEEHFNTIHSKCRCTIERCFGVLKGRWRCLLKARELNYEPVKVAKIINVCCMLHNWCIKYNVQLDEELFLRGEADIQSNNPSGSSTNVKTFQQKGKELENK